MKKTILFISILMVAFFGMPVMPVHAAGLAQVNLPPNVLDIVLKLALGFASLVGVSSLVAVLVQILKAARVVQDNTASRWAAGLNLLSFIGLIYFGVFQPQIATQVLDGYAAQLAQVALFMLGFIVQITSSKPAYDALKASRVPLLGYSITKG